MRHAEDQSALAALVRDPETMALARDPESVRLLWEVCQVPDFQSVLTEAHTRLLGPRLPRPARSRTGRIAEDFLASHVKDLDRTEGEVDALLGRIAAIRTWTYLVQSLGVGGGPALLAGDERAPSRTGSPTRCTSGSPQEFVDRPSTVIARYDALGAGDERSASTVRCWCKACGPASSRASASAPTGVRGGLARAARGREPRAARRSCASGCRPSRARTTRPSPRTRRRAPLAWRRRRAA